MKTDVLGVLYDNITMEEAVAAGRAFLTGSKTAYCVTPNAEMAYEALHNESFRTLLNSADLVLPDGAGVVLGAKILKTPLKQKVAGIEFAQNMLPVYEELGSRLYLLGSKPGVAELAAERMLEKHPKLIICGTADGYFKDESEVVRIINEAAADVLYVCLGAPKQEFFMFNHKDELNVRLMAGLGGTLDGIAGTVKRAPKWMIRLQLEWLYRLIKEPRRLGRMMRLPKFILAAIKKRWKGKEYGKTDRV
ncbi:MAG: WecB/TagA/CpsF family glycosyltransferase [Clostridia bacterium]|nr:WecB/TagA/CpsF family glycosyltransferase [Oscillospiraceae bacterium]MBQ3763323.1 WecB/TagA/CpsF family glycosyltransferase [Clostridia bacterium]